MSAEDQSQQPLKVQDALSYLDQVKLKFSDRPAVYNSFLDIMKEFKSQSLNTPGVITRVSGLFQGHPDLIVGFNTFLPQGYKIEQMPHNNEIGVTTPASTRVRTIQQLQQHEQQQQRFTISQQQTTTVTNQPSQAAATTQSQPQPQTQPQSQAQPQPLIIQQPGHQVGATQQQQLANQNLSQTQQQPQQQTQLIQAQNQIQAPVTTHQQNSGIQQIGLQQQPQTPQTQQQPQQALQAPRQVQPQQQQQQIHQILPQQTSTPSMQIHQPLAQQRLQPRYQAQQLQQLHLSRAPTANQHLATSQQQLFQPLNQQQQPIQITQQPLHQGLSQHQALGTPAHQTPPPQQLAQTLPQQQPQMIQNQHQAIVPQQQQQQIIHQASPQQQAARASRQPGAECGFNHALNYVNKIKHRFSANPEIYQQFLEILHAYQRDQHTKVPRSKMLLENEVYTQVARLFQNQQDLLEEFGQFLPDANGTHSTGGGTINSLTYVHQHSPTQNSNSSIGMAVRHVTPEGSRVLTTNDPTLVKRQISRNSPSATGYQPKRDTMQLKRQNANASANANLSYGSLKRPRMTSLRDVSLAEAGKHGSLNEYAFFDKVRKALRSQEVYDNFLRCLVLYNHEILSRTELIQLVTTFLGRFPELLKWFKDFLGYKEGTSLMGSTASLVAESSTYDNLSNQMVHVRQRERERLASEAGVEIDYSSCKRHGASYRGLPKNFVQPKCTGRTPLCKEVLNDTLVSFPSWSEDSTFVSSRKTQYEEYIYRCEDERFELDVVIESNLLTIRVLEAVKRKMELLPYEERCRFKLDDTLGGTSNVIHQRAIKRIYGDKAPEIIEGLKKNPVIAVPLILRRLKAKDEEWRDAQKQFNKIWRDQNEKYYLKSLDHQGISFKQNDIKFLRSKSLIKEIEDLQKENQEEDLNVSAAGGDAINNQSVNQPNLPHITLVYKDKEMLEEACNLIIHHVKRQTSIHKEEKQKIKQLMRHFIPDLFSAPRGDLSDDEMDETNDEMMEDETSDKPFPSNMDINKLSYGERNQHTKKNDQAASSPKRTSSRDLFKINCDEPPLKDLEAETGKEPPSPPEKSIQKLSQETKSQVPTEMEKSTSLSEAKDQEISISVEPESRDSAPLKSPHILQNNDPDDSYTLFYLDNKWYCFFRLHHILCQRLGTIYERAKVLIAEEEKERKDRRESTAIALRLKPKNDIEVEDYFAVFVDMIKQLLDGNLDSNQYEDMLRDMFGIYAYVAFTMDKVVQNIVRQLQHIVADEVTQQCTNLFLEESKNDAAGGKCATANSRSIDEANYQKKIEQILEDEFCFKVIMYKSETKLTIELLDTETREESDDDQAEKWSDYVDNEYVRENAKLAESRRWFLTRNVRRYMSRERRMKVCKETQAKKLNMSENDKVQCEFNPNDYRRLLIFNQGEHVTFYKRHRLSKAMQSRVNELKRGKFSTWNQRWLGENADPEKVKECCEWIKVDKT